MLTIHMGEDSCGGPIAWADGHVDLTEFARAVVAHPDWAADGSDDVWRVRDAAAHRLAVRGVDPLTFAFLPPSTIELLGLEDRTFAITHWSS